MRTGAASRPYFQFLAQDLEAEFEANKGNLTVVRALRAELYQRTSAHALRLRNRIDAHLLRAVFGPVPAQTPAVHRPALISRPAPVARHNQQNSKPTRTWVQRLGMAVLAAILGIFGCSAYVDPKKLPVAVQTVPWSAVSQNHAAREQKVYVTRTGAKYHQAGCRYLCKSKTPVTLDDARKCYGPCSVCRPQK